MDFLSGSADVAPHYQLGEVVNGWRRLFCAGSPVAAAPGNHASLSVLVPLSNCLGYSLDELKDRFFTTVARLRSEEGDTHRGCSDCCRAPFPRTVGDQLNGPRGWAARPGTVERVARPLLDPAPSAPAPMLATLRAAPVRGENLATEWKWDGQRATVIVTGTDVRVLSRNGADITRTFPELASVADAVGRRPLILDGEIVALDAQGRPSFTRLQQRWPQQRRPTSALLREVPVRLMAFDIVELEGRRLTDRPWIERRQLLDSVVAAEHSRVLTVPKAFIDVSPVEMLAVAATHGLEGIVVKPVASPYISGRSGLWTKVPVRLTAELVIAGFWCAGGPGGRSAIGSLLVAGHDDDGRLVAVGQVGTGFSASMRHYLFSLLDPIVQPRSPLTVPVEAAGVRWVAPQYVGEVAYREYVTGHWLRHTSWKGLRDSAISSVRLPADSSTMIPQ